ncbi:MAG: hypothetical protein Q7T18_00065, partial [Sedimentisphaerales bacterium]|nr:hypothetical protein [Sedimentisphaerales bacterium]
RTGDTWQFTSLTAPAKATSPTPAHNATGVVVTTDLSWNRGAATSVDVWFAKVGEALVKVLSDTTAAAYDTGTMLAGTQYQWRVDTKNAAGTTQGDLWLFTTLGLPEKASLPDPMDQALDVPRNKTLAWTDPGNKSTSFRIYFSTVLADVTNKSANALISPDLSIPSWTPGLMLANTAYYWRIISISAQGSTDGDVWRFTTSSSQAAAPIFQKYKKRLCAIADNKFWYSNTAVPVQMVALAGLAPDTGKDIAMVDAYQKIFIINDGNAAGNYWVVDFANTRLKVASSSWNFTTNYVPQRGSIISQNAARMVVDYVEIGATDSYVYGYVTAGTFVTTTTCTATDSEGRPTSFSPSQVTTPAAAPFWYKWQPYPNRLIANSSSTRESGIMPLSATIITLYRGRVVLAGDRTAPHQWYMAEQGNPFNFAYGTDSPQAPVAGTNTDIGKIADV